ncbi:BZ3500_MvSof-1268-A1-R1_Chr9g10822 [Microbotryum saponariae]|uniref:BZ3500_MvSof-1268-A1-R1_Chr9g10822 protein n=1 Tax=Microbotryum saponariae TaxID=289078 RepID=A0A2X0KDD7_9BASI|nr:BZ3501_MvSof-1269-A2-R1_Chr9g10570 [Microbotryum saponariae]SDA00754.1 BZ3500_MvSof-1268-A1-R1_Chr9g10822 [Microbotryum saponariae]
MAEVRSLHVELAEESSQASSFTFNDRRSPRDDDDTDNGHGHGHDTDDSQGSNAPAFAATTVHQSSSRSHPTHRFAASLHTPFQGSSTGLPSPPDTAQRPLSSNGVYPTAARARPLSNGQLGTASMTPVRLTPLRRVNLVESRSSINRIGATSSPLSAGVHFKNGAFGGSHAGTHQSPFPAPTSKKWLVMVKGPPILPHSPPPNDASGFARAYGASGRYDGGVLMPLQNSLSAQVALIAREFSLPSIGGVALYLCLNNSTNVTPSVPMARRISRATSASLSTAPDDVSSRPASMLSTNEYHEPEMFKPRILEETWGTLWAAFLDPLGVVGESVQGPFGPSLAIAGMLEFDIDPRRAHWLANCYSSSDPNEYHHSTPAVPPSSHMSTPTLSAPQLRHVPRGSEVAHRALQGNRGGSQVGRRGRSISYVWHQPEEQEQRSRTPARSTDEEVPHELVRSTLGGHFGDRDDSNFDPRLVKSLEGSERGSFGGMMLRDMNDVGFEDEDQDSEEPDSDVPSDVTSHDDSLTTDLEVLHDLRTVEVGAESAAFESFDHFLTSTPGPSSSANRQLSTQDRDGTGSPRRETAAVSCSLEPLAERSSLDEHHSTALVEYGQAMTSIEAVSDLHEVALLDLSQKDISPRHQVSMSDGEQASSGNKSIEDFEREDVKCSAENVEHQSSSRGESLDLLHGDAPSESAAVVDDPRTAAHQPPPSTALEPTNKLTSTAKVTYPYFQLYPPHPPYFVSATKTPSTPSPTGSFSKLMSSPKRRGAPPSPLQIKQHGTDGSDTKTKEVPEKEDQEVHVRNDPQMVTEGGQPWDETTPQDAIFAEYAQASPSGYDESTGFPEAPNFPQEIDLDQVDQAKLKEASNEESGLLLSASPHSTSSSSGSSMSTTFERALKTSGHRNVLSLGESDTGSDIMPLSALFRPPPSGHFDSAFDFQPSPIATTNSSMESFTSPNRRPPSPTLNATELNSTSSNISAFVRAMGHPDDGVPFDLPAQGTDNSLENPLEVGDDSMDSIGSMGTDKLAAMQTSFDLNQGIPAEGLLVGIGGRADDDDDDEDEDSDDDGIELGEDQSCQIFDHLPSSPLPAVLEAEIPNSSPQHLPTAAVEA